MAEATGCPADFPTMMVAAEPPQSKPYYFRAVVVHCPARRELPCAPCAALLTAHCPARRTLPCLLRAALPCALPACCPALQPARRPSLQPARRPYEPREWFSQRRISGSVGAAALGASEFAAALGASETAAALGASETAATGASESATNEFAISAEALHTFTLDSGSSRCFFRDCTTVTPLAAPVPVSLAGPTGGPVVAQASTVLPCSAIPSGSLSGLHLPSFSTNLVINAVLQDVWVDTFIPGGQRVTICTYSPTGRHLATFTRQPGSSLYTLTTGSAQVAASGQVAASSQASASGQFAASCSCWVLSHLTLLWHHRLNHPSLPRLRSMHSRLLVSGLPRSLPPLLRSPAPPCLPCVEGRQRAATVTRLLADVSESVCHPSVGGEPALGCEVLEDRQFELECLAAALPRFASMLICPEGDPGALDIPTPRSYAEAIAGHSLSAPPSDESVESSGMYPELVGCLMYLMTCTRPDLAYPLSLLARYVAPGIHQKLRWLTYPLTDLGERPCSPPVLYVDNKAMLALCHEQRLEHRTKHIALHYFLPREPHRAGQLRLSYVASRANTADVFTKALRSGDHQRFCTALGLLPVLPHLPVA
ncbi:unnamed protein product [Closterium sp. NIES-54]